MPLAPTDPGMLFFIAKCGYARNGRGLVCCALDAHQADYQYIVETQVPALFPSVPALLQLCAAYDPQAEGVVVVASGQAVQVQRVQRQADGRATVVQMISSTDENAFGTIRARSALEARLLALGEEYAVYVEQTEQAALDPNEHRLLLSQRSVVHNEIIAVFDDLELPYTDRHDVRHQVLAMVRRGWVRDPRRLMDHEEASRD